MFKEQKIRNKEEEEGEKRGFFVSRFCHQQWERKAIAEQFVTAKVT
jgi:hypothetical protein